MAEGTRWGADGLPDGQPKKTYYDPFGRPRVLPADSGHSLQHYLDQGLTLEPPENPIPIEKLGDFARRDEAQEGPMSATRQVAPSEVPKDTPNQSPDPNIEMLLARIEQLEAERGQKKRKRGRKRNRA